MTGWRASSAVKSLAPVTFVLRCRLPCAIVTIHTKPGVSPMLTRYALVLTDESGIAPPKRVEASAQSRADAALRSLDFWTDYTTAEVTHVFTAKGDAREVRPTLKVSR